MTLRVAGASFFHAFSNNAFSSIFSSPRWNSCLFYSTGNKHALMKNGARIVTSRTGSKRLRDQPLWHPLLLGAGSRFCLCLGFQCCTVYLRQHWPASTHDLGKLRRRQRIQHVLLGQPRATKLQNTIANVFHVRSVVRVCINDELYSLRVGHAQVLVAQV